MKYKEELNERRNKLIKQTRWYQMRYEKGKISLPRYSAIEDSLNEEYKSFKSKAPRGTWTQLGTRLWIYDLDSRNFTYNAEIKDEQDNSIILNRDDYNSYSLTAVKGQANSPVSGPT